MGERLCWRVSARNFFWKINFMQVRIFSIPMIGGEAIMEEMNAFLRSKKIVQMEQQLTVQGQDTYWSFCVRYTDDYSVHKNKEKKDYQSILGEDVFKRFLALKKIRIGIARKESLPAYAIFSDEELAEMAKIDELTLEKMKGIKGIGEKKIEKYGSLMLNKDKDEKDE
jgi:superfamily II DNA helicase RecQ